MSGATSNVFLLFYRHVFLNNKKLYIIYGHKKKMNIYIFKELFGCHNLASGNSESYTNFSTAPLLHSFSELQKKLKKNIMFGHSSKENLISSNIK